MSSLLPFRMIDAKRTRIQVQMIDRSRCLALAGLVLSALGCGAGGASSDAARQSSQGGVGGGGSAKLGIVSNGGTPVAPARGGTPNSGGLAPVPVLPSAGGASAGGAAVVAGGANAGEPLPSSGAGGAMPGTGGTAPSAGGTSSAGGTPSVGGTPPSVGGMPPSVGGTPPVGPPLSDSECAAVATDPNVNWREGAARTDQAIVECLWSTLGQPVGYGEKARGGYDPGGNSRLVVIKKNAAQSVEKQLLDAISGTEHAWIVFDKSDFREAHEVAMYRTHCDNSAVLSHIQGTAEECRDYRSWCAKRGAAGEGCLDAFFNNALNNKDLPIRNAVIGSNKTLDGRGSQAYVRFNGFAVGRDSNGEPTETAKSVIVTHLEFRGAGHTEDHQLDPDMLRLTGASEDIWVHKNTFDLTGDSAFDVKVGAHHITMSFNRVVNVKRAALHGSKDGRVINAQIRTTMHHNAFVTTEENYKTLGNTGRRVPLIRRGKSHVWNNVFVNYRKEVLSVRVGASVLWEDNAFVINAGLQEKSSVEASLAEVSQNLLKDVDGGNFRTSGSRLWFSDKACRIDGTTKTELSQSSGNVADLSQDYDEDSKTAIESARSEAGQALLDYVTATAGRNGAVPFNSPLALSASETIQASQRPCQ